MSDHSNITAHIWLDDSVEQVLSDMRLDLALDGLDDSMLWPVEDALNDVDLDLSQCEEEDPDTGTDTARFLLDNAREVVKRAKAALFAAQDEVERIRGAIDTDVRNAL